MGESKPHSLPGLTGLRGLAALWVFAYHIFKSFAGDGAAVLASDAIPFLREGWRGVDLFFILSGFVIAHVHLGDFAHPARGRVKAYLLRRFWRVYPLNAFWHGAIVLLFLAAPFVLTVQARFQPVSVTPEAFLASIFLVQSWIPGYSSAWNWPSWSLSAEIAAYLLFPLLAVTANRLRRPAQCWAVAGFAIVMLGLLLATLGVLGTNAVEYYTAVLRAVFCFTAGVALCRAVSLAPLPAEIANRLALAGLALAIAGCLGSPWNYLWVPASALFIAAASSKGSVAASFLSARPIYRLGEVSFSLYLSHWPVILILRTVLVERGPDAGIFFAAAAIVATLIATMAITYASWRFIEAPMHRYGRRMSDAKTRP